ncbi:MFS transporter [Trueperella bialowiezensis]|uniref:Arabinose efflux permease n=1 Tax=Trueperella bialowiezensis TaxID=312285 RepID=A0A3S4WH52_9ACTO|nr:MFS transporter [Trueperella bialowiezensis]VEI13802.1 Arabinose efflux permease [Trueperella bialowiezensis]
MLHVLQDRTYAKLFAAQVIALIGTGLLTVALGLLAYDIAGSDGGAVLGMAMTIKMLAYVFVSPVAAALTSKLPRRTVLVVADLLRAATALALPFVTEAWHIYALIFVLQSASATFTPTFQAVIPSILPQEEDYTQALSLSRLAYDLEALASPALAAALLSVTSYNNLFIGTVVGFLGSAALVMSARFPQIETESESPFLERVTRGVRIFWRTPDLRGLMGANLAVSAPIAMVIVNTAVLTMDHLQRSESEVAILLAVNGAGSMIVALTLPKVLTVRDDRQVMLAGCLALPALLVLGAGAIQLSPGALQWVALLALWGILGTATSLVLTPSARLLRRASVEKDRPAVYAAQFSLSHACYLVAYPLAGIVGAKIGLASVSLVLGAVALLGVVIAGVEWRRRA